MTELQSLEVEEAGVRVRHGGTDVAVLRANPEDVLDSDSFAGGEHFGELRLHRPDIAAPTAVLSGLTGALFLGIRRRISGALHLRSETSTATGSISMDGHALRLKATIVAATGTLTALRTRVRNAFWDDAQGRERVRVEGNTGRQRHFDANGRVRVDTDGRSGTIVLSDASGRPRLRLSGQTGRITLVDAAGNDTLVLDSASGDITLANADCAEELDVAPGVHVEAGMVVRAGACGVVPASTPCDPSVLGVVSGAGEFAPAIVLDRRANAVSRVAVAMAGKVGALADASERAVCVGDRLTASSRPGYVMAAPANAPPGSIVGKALSGLGTGQGLVTMWVWGH